MALIRCWAVGILVLVVTEYVQIRVVYDNLVGPDGVDSFGSALAFVHVPNLLCVVLATWAAARVHPEPWRQMPARHVAAACAVPAAGQLLTVSLRPELANVSSLALWMSTGVLLAGCSMGLLLDKWWEGREA
ncbi:hypothetical protein ACFY1L_09675 [Streptomyces sp. NPDC001663]|uniref:hypothetical protein n=1 Tax=Streptomyces sp. NPDC001663 TaxID=3364597 RepID=UPI00368C23A7